jgi:hypothetical protein
MGKNLSFQQETQASLKRDRVTRDYRPDVASGKPKGGMATVRSLVKRGIYFFFAVSRRMISS